jgi:hypothetical protein
MSAAAARATAALEQQDNASASSLEECASSASMSLRNAELSMLVTQMTKTKCVPQPKAGAFG